MSCEEIRLRKRHHHLVTNGSPGVVDYDGDDGGGGGRGDDTSRVTSSADTCQNSADEIFSKSTGHALSRRLHRLERIRFACRRVLLNCVHLVIGLVLSLVARLRVIAAAAKRFAYGRSTIAVAAEFGSMRSQFKKVPVHFALILDDDASLNAAIADLISWCIVFGIPYVTLYNHGGLSKNRAEQFRRCINGRMGRILPHSKCKVIVLDGEPSMQNNNLQQLERKDVIYVQLISCQDGRQDLVDSAKRLVKLRASTEEPASKLLIADFVEQIQSNRGFPCPDVLVCCRETFSTIGFLPWHINLTEIFYFPTEGQMTFDTFQGILSRFEKCEQRLGK